jgi:CRP-like cAMP-binding protein
VSQATTAAPVGHEIHDTIWGQLGAKLGLVSLRPKLAHDVRVRKIEDEYELVQLSTGRVIGLGDSDVRLVRQFDGTNTIAEMVAAELGVERKLAIQPVLELIDRVVRAEMLDNFPPNMFRQLDAHLAKTAVEWMRDRTPAEVLDAEAAGEGSISQYEQVPWRPKTPLMEERAQFLRQVELLRPLDLWAIGALAESAHEEAFPAASNIITEGGRAERFYIIRSGEVNVTKLDDEGVARRIAKLDSYDWFGEIGLLDAASRSATVRAGPSRPVQVYSFDAATFERYVAPHVSSFRGRHIIGKRREQLGKVRLFEDLEHTDLEHLAHAIREHHVPQGTTVFQQGEEGDRFYIVVEGSVGIVRDGVPVAKISAGDFFGETALLFTEARTATVITTEDSVLWSIDKAAFTGLVRSALLNRRDMMPTVLNRLNR